MNKNPYIHEQGAWETSEVERLKSMDALQAHVAVKDIEPVFQLAGHQIGSFLDIGAGTGSTARELCQHYDVPYIALDVNSTLLGAREEGDSLRVRASSNHLPFADGAIDVTYSKAVTAWNSDPRGAIAEQLRVTKGGGMAIFTEFDWSKAGPGKYSSPEEEMLINRIRSVLMGMLQASGFRPNYGATLADEVRAVIKEKNIRGECHETVHAFPEGDHSELLIGAAESLVQGVYASGKAADENVANILRLLEADMDAFRDLPTPPSFAVPNLVTIQVSMAS